MSELSHFKLCSEGLHKIEVNGIIVFAKAHCTDVLVCFFSADCVLRQ